MSERVILVIDDELERAADLKGMIEFMDSPAVRISVPDEWQAQLGASRAAAIFLAETLPPDTIERIVQEIGNLDPNIPIVLMDKDKNG